MMNDTYSLPEQGSTLKESGNYEAGKQQNKTQVNPFEASLYQIR